jgi:hypothetical protein
MDESAVGDGYARIACADEVIELGWDPSLISFGTCRRKSHSKNEQSNESHRRLPIPMLSRPSACSNEIRLTSFAFGCESRA